MSFGKPKHQVRIGKNSSSIVSASLIFLMLTLTMHHSGTHTHSAPAGFLQYTLYQMTSYGFSEETMSAFVEGIAQSILRYAHVCHPVAADSLPWLVSCHDT